MLKPIFKRIFRDHQGVPFRVIFWDGTQTRFGHGLPKFAIHFRTARALRRSLTEISLGFGESYAAGDIVVDGDLVEALCALAEAYDRLGKVWDLLPTPRRSLEREKSDIETHYGLGNAFYSLFLDSTLQYSCAYFRRRTDSLEQAQKQKIDYSLKKLNLYPGLRLLDIGCGWGNLLFTAAEKYGVHGTGITLCENQARYIRERADATGLPVDVRVVNYLELTSAERWDRVVSIGMMEHIGEDKIDVFHDKIRALLKPGAICLLHCIAKMRETRGSDPFIRRHIFPGYWFPSLEGLTRRSVERGHQILDVENLRPHYVLTAEHWRSNFHRNWDKIREKMKFDESFMRSWDYYLAQVIAGFRLGKMHLIQMVMSNGLETDYPLTRDHLFTALSSASRKSAYPDNRRARLGPAVASLRAETPAVAARQRSGRSRKSSESQRG